MATTNMLKFYRLGNEAMATKTVATGAIWFNTDDNTIQIKTASGWEKYAGKLNNATWDANKQKLTITKYDGSSIELDFSDIASGTSVKAALAALETKLQDNIDGANAAAKTADDKAVAAQADVDALEDAVGSGFSKDSTVASQLAAVKATADAAAVKADVDAALELKADKTQVAADIATAKSGAEATAAADATTKANKAKEDAISEATRLDGLTNSRIDTVEYEYKAADENLQEQIDDIVTAAVSVKNADNDAYVTVTKAEDKNEYTVATKGIDTAIANAVAAEKNEREAADAELQGAINAEKGRIDTLVGSDTGKSAREIVQDEVALQLTSENITDSFDTLKEMAEWLSSHPEDVTEMNQAISKNASDIADVSADLTAEIERSTQKDEAHDTAIKALQDADAAQAELNATLATKTELANEKSALNALIEANAAAIKTINDTTVPGLEDRLDGHDDDVERINGVLATLETKEVVSGINTRLSAAEADIDGAQEDIANLQAGTGLADGSSAPVYNNANYIASASTMVAADLALDAKIKEVAESVTNKNVSAEGDGYITATASNNKVTVTAVTGTVESKSGLATNEGVYEAMCWVEFA